MGIVCKITIDRSDKQGIRAGFQSRRLTTCKCLKKIAMYIIPCLHSTSESWLVGRVLLVETMLSWHASCKFEMKVRREESMKIKTGEGR